MPEALTIAAVGRPVTALVEHELLTDDMVVTAATSIVDTDRDWLELELNLPTSGLDLESGELLAAGASGPVA